MMQAGSQAMIRHRTAAFGGGYPPAQQRRRHAVLARSGQGRSQTGGYVVNGHSATSPAGWDAMRAALRAAGVKVVSPQEVGFAAERDAVLVVDVRPAEDYLKGHIPGAANVPFYRPITGWDAMKLARRVGFAMFGILQGTEVNPDFTAEVKQLLQRGGGKELILYCSQGGELESTTTHQRGWQTRSLVAAYDLCQQGVTSAVLRGGYFGWYNAGRDIEVFEFENDDAEASGDEELAS